MNTQDSTRSFNPFAHRIVALRAKDSYFDALCETCIDLDHQVGAAESGPVTNLESQRLKQQRSSCLDTIMFMLDDASSQRRAA